MSEKIFGRKEVSQHSLLNDLWIIINGDVYDITDWLPKHPGGKLPLMQVGGRDATLAFITYHPKYAETIMKSYRIGSLPKVETSSQLLDNFVAMNEQMKKDGIFQTDYYDYSGTIFLQIITFIISIILFSKGTVLSTFIGGISLAFFWQQIAFIGHDAGHAAITHNMDSDWWIGKVITIFFGVSGEWWRKSHNTHHVAPNSIDWDPDIQHLPFLAISEKIFDGFFSYYHNQKFFLDSLAVSFISRQGLFFIPIMGCARIFMHVQSFVRCFQNDISNFRRYSELAALLSYWIWFLSVLLYLIPTNSLRVLMIWTSHLFVGILHCQITLSHFSMDSYMGRQKQDYMNDPSTYWIRLQCETTMDVDSYSWMDWFHGGLHFQAIHHLFPRIPRHKLRIARNKYVLPFLNSHGITYYSSSWLGVFLHVYSNILKQQKNVVQQFSHKKTWWSELVIIISVLVYTWPVISIFV